MRGTLPKRVGRTSLSSSSTAGTLVAYAVAMPRSMRPQNARMRSATWAIGRNESEMSERANEVKVAPLRVTRMFACEIIAPLGGPVVPLV